MGRWTLLLTALLAAGCSTHSQIGDDCAGTVCGEACCGVGEVCQAGACCTSSCDDKTCGSDGCGGSCGECEQGWTCGAAGSCECPAESDEAFCARLGVVCGTATGKDGCGRDRQVACDRCGTNQRCDAETAACVCTETDVQICQRLGKDCDTLTTEDLCGEARTVSCGTCPAGELCSASNTCELCTPLGDRAFCVEQGKQCGTFTATDACSQQSRDPDCGGCDPGLDCDPANRCVPCTAETAEAFCRRVGKSCGTVSDLDNCRRARTEDCGSCTGTDFCDDTNHCHACIHESDASLCTRTLTACGPLVAVDNCGDERSVDECGPCPAGAAVCRDAACVACTEETDAQLCSSYFRYCGTLTATDSCDQARYVASCGSCLNPGTSCQPSGACGVAGTPTNDNCTSPERLLLDASGHATVTGDLINAGNDGDGSCSGYVQDVVYAIVLTRTQNLRATAGGVNSIHIRSTCEQLRSELPYGCAIPKNSNPASLSVRALTPGTYYLWVEGSSPFTLEVQATDVVTPGNDQCSGAAPLALQGAAAAAMGDTIAAGDDASGSCGSMVGPDLVYSLTLPSPSALLVEVTPDSGDPKFLPTVYLRSNCSSTAAADESGCGIYAPEFDYWPQPYVPAIPGRAIGRNLAAGTWYIVVDGAQGTFGRFNLQAQVLPPVTNDTCTGAVAIPINATTGYGSVTADNLMGADGVKGGCAPFSTGRSLVFAFEVPAGGPKNAVIGVLPAASSQAAPAVSVRSSCDQAATERACAAVVSPATHDLHLTRLAPGTWYVWVDDPTGATNSNPYTLSVQLGDPLPAPTNDICTSPAPLVLDRITHTAQASGTTVDATDELTGVCGAAAGRHAGPDVVYTFEVRDVSNTVVRVTPTASSPTFQPAVYLRSVCGDSSSDLGCGNAPSAGGTATFSISNLAVGTYFIVVDGAWGTSGDFDLTVMSYDAMNNDGCANAKPLVFDAAGTATAATDTCLATNDATATCGGWCQACGNDVVYSFTLAATSDVSATLAPGHAGLSALHVRTTCGSASSELKCSEVDAGGTNALRLRSLGAGTYYLFVDAGSQICGLFSLQLTATPALPLAGNDTCATAQAISIDTATGIGTASGNTLDATGDTNGACRTGSGPELVYRFTLTETVGVEATVTPSLATATLRPVAYLRNSCQASAAEIGCAMSTATGAPAVLTAPRLDAGTYYLFVDSFSNNLPGPFDVQVKTVPAAAPANDLCAQASLLEFDAAGKATATGDTGPALDDYVSLCSTAANLLTGPDLVYTFTLTAPAAVTAKVSRGTGNTVYRPAVSIRGSCSSADELTCARDASGVSTAATTLPAGTYFVFVDGVTTTTAGTAYGPFTLELTKSAPIAADGCGNPEPLVVDPATHVATASGTTSGLTLSSEASCYGPSGPDAVYSLTLAADSLVKITVNPGGASQGLTPVVYLRSSCADVATELGCVFTSGVVAPPAVLTLNRVPAGTYYVWVDSGSSSRVGAYALTVEVSAPAAAAPDHDACGGAQAIVLDPVSLAAHVTGDTSAAANDYVGTCAGVSGTLVYPLAGPDVVYSVAVPRAGTLYALLQRGGGSSSYNPGLYLRSRCASNAAADELACSAPVSGSGATLVKDVQPGTYYLVVDGQRSSAGAFAMDLVLRTSPVVGNDSCASAEPIALDATGSAIIAGDLRGMADDSFGSCNTTTTGGDAVYTLDLPSTKDVSLDLMPGVGLFPMVYVRSSCGEFGTEIGCIHSTSNAPVQLVSQRLSAGTWYVIVDANSATGVGPFALRVKATDPSSAANDSCRAPEPLAFDASGTATVTATTRAGGDDYSGRCRTAIAPLDGPDLVYSFTLDSAANVTATATAASADLGYRPALYLRRDCASDAADHELACASGTTTSTSVATSLPAGTYYLFVDGVARTAGAFTLTVQQTAAAVLGDTCADAQVLSFAGDVATFSGDTTNAGNSGEGNCQASSKGDVVYAFSLPAESKVDVSVIPGAQATLRPYLYVRASCNDKYGPEYGCATTFNAAPMALSIPRLAAGTYYLWVDTNASWAGGPFSGTVTLSPPVPLPLNDTCAGATPLVFNGTRATVVDDTRLALNDGTGNCASAFGPDLVYSFTLAADQMVTATVTRDSTTANFQPSVYIRSVCDQSADRMELGCGKGNYSGVATATVETLHAGTYYVWVDGTQSAVTDTPGKFTLVVTLAAPVAGPANDNCTSVTSLTFTNDRAVVSLDTTLASDDTQSVCVTNIIGTDVVYAFTLASAQQLSATLVGGNGYSPALELRRTCGSGTPGSFVACVSQYTSGGTAALTLPYLAAGTYYLWADAGKTATKGTGTLTVALDTPTSGTEPPNDTCATAIPLTRGVAVTGTTVNAAADYLDPPWSAVCSSLAGTAVPLGPDVVYSYTPATSGEFQVVLAPSSTFDAMLIVTEQVCDLGAACVAMMSTWGNGTIEKASVRGIAGHTYYVIVDSTQTSKGTFTLFVR